MSAESIDQALERECRRVNRRYAIEIVEALGFCPFAEPCRTANRTSEVVMLERGVDVTRSLREAEKIARETRIEVAFLLWPRVYVDRLTFSRFVETLRAEHQRRSGQLVMAMEGFHPHAEADMSNPERLVPFLRRTPDPTIQL